MFAAEFDRYRKQFINPYLGMAAVVKVVSGDFCLVDLVDSKSRLMVRASSGLKIDDEVRLDLYYLVDQSGVFMPKNYCLIAVKKC